MLKNSDEKFRKCSFFLYIKILKIKCTLQNNLSRLFMLGTKSVKLDPTHYATTCWMIKSKYSIFGLNYTTINYHLIFQKYCNSNSMDGIGNAAIFKEDCEELDTVDIHTDVLMKERYFNDFFNFANIGIMNEHW